MRQRLREWLWDASDNSDRQRRQREVLPCFAALMRWIVQLRHTNADESRSPPVPAIDATTLGTRVTVPAISVLVGGVAIPVARTRLPGNRKRQWKPRWETLMDAIRAGIPRDTAMLVLADRGLSGAWLFRQIVRRRWHPPLRLKRRGCCRPDGSPLWVFIASLTPNPGTQRSVGGEVFKRKGSRLHATVLAYWTPEVDQPWLLLTDLMPESVDPSRYGRRVWIEQGLRVFKRTQWQWNRTRMTDPKRIERLWLPMALASLWTASMGDPDRWEAFPQEFVSIKLDADMRRRISRVTLGHAVLLRLTEGHDAVLLGKLNMNLPNHQTNTEAFMPVIIDVEPNRR